MATLRGFLKISCLISSLTPLLALAGGPELNDVTAAKIAAKVSPDGLPSADDGEILYYVADNGTDDLRVTSVNQSGGWTGETWTGYETVTTPAFLQPLLAPLVYMVFVRNDGKNELNIASSSDGINWGPSYAIPGVKSKFAPALGVLYSFNPYTYQVAVAYVADDGTNDLYAIRTKPLAPLSPASEIKWESPVKITRQLSKTAPAMTTFLDSGEEFKLVLAYVADNASNDLLITTSTDGIHWTADAQVKGPQEETPQATPLAPALVDAVISNKSTLVLGYVANNGSNDLLVSTSTDAVNWTNSSSVQGQQSSVAPALQVSSNDSSVIMAYVAEKGSHDLSVTTSSDGIHWGGSGNVGTQTSKAAPALGILLVQ